MNIKLCSILTIVQIISLSAMDTSNHIISLIKNGNWNELRSCIEKNNIEFSSPNPLLKQYIAQADTSGSWQVAQLLAKYILTQPVTPSDKPLFYISGKIDLNADWLTGIYQKNIDTLRAVLPKATYASKNIAGATGEEFSKEFNRQYRGLGKALSKNNLLMRYAVIQLFGAEQTPQFCFFNYVGITQKDMNHYKAQLRSFIQKQIVEVE